MEIGGGGSQQNMKGINTFFDFPMLSQTRICVWTICLYDSQHKDKIIHRPFLGEEEEEEEKEEEEE